MRSPTTDRARSLRNSMTKTERRLWSRPKSRQVDDFKFRRQFPVGPYFVDFLCISARLAIEVDGPLHEDVSDQLKTERLRRDGYRVMRIPVSAVDESLDDVVHEGLHRLLFTCPVVLDCPRVAGDDTFDDHPQLRLIADLCEPALRDDLGR